jgi:hypothetical protein
MWECPGCSLMALNPEILDTHMKATPKCSGKVFNLRGWQGVDLDGLPKSRIGEVLWKEDE